MGGSKPVEPCAAALLSTSPFSSGRRGFLGDTVLCACGLSLVIRVKILAHSSLGPSVQKRGFIPPAKKRTSAYRDYRILIGKSFRIWGKIRKCHLFYLSAWKISTNESWGEEGLGHFLN